MLFAPVVKWISQRSSEPLLRVRILPGAQEKANFFAFGRIRKVFLYLLKINRKTPGYVVAESFRVHKDRYKLSFYFLRRFIYKQYFN